MWLGRVLAAIHFLTQKLKWSEIDCVSYMVKKVLIVEDSADISGSLKLLIEMEGYESIVAHSGDEGRQKAIDEKPALILMDLLLPGLNGISLTHELRSNSETSGIPILCISSNIKGREEQIAAAGFDGVYSKTDFMTSFAETLKKYLDD